MNKYDTGVVIRLFNPGAGKSDLNGSIKPLDQKWFKTVAASLESILASKDVPIVVVVNNVDQNSNYSEGKVDGMTPTHRALKEEFSFYYDNGKLAVIEHEDWGKNPGSGRAVQAGIDYLLRTSATPNLMVWSPELAIDEQRLHSGLEWMYKNHLDAIGFLREHWFKRPQWMLPQHTAFIGTRAHWKKATIPEKADGDEERYIETSAGKALVAGMDDFCRQLEVIKVDPNFKFGMFGASNPLPWNIDWNDTRQIQKIERQWQVAKTWAQEAYPDQPAETTIDQFFRRMIIG